MKNNNLKRNDMFKYFMCLLLFQLVLACSNSRDSKDIYIDSNESVSIGSKIPVEKFDLFFYKFERDSLFQITRIKFPLPGFSMELQLSNPDEKSKQIDGEAVNTNWQLKDWVMHKSFINNGDYKHDRKLTDSLVTDLIYILNSDFQIKRKFKLINNKWYLVYYFE